MSIPHNNPRMKVLLFSFYERRNRGSEVLINLPSIQMREIKRYKLPGTKKSQYEMYSVGNIVNSYVIKSLVL